MPDLVYVLLKSGRLYDRSIVEQSIRRRRSKWHARNIAVLEKHYLLEYRRKHRSDAFFRVGHVPRC
jgi:hypothetical protein